MLIFCFESLAIWSRPLISIAINTYFLYGLRASNGWDTYAHDDADGLQPAASTISWVLVEMNAQSKLFRAAKKASKNYVMYLFQLEQRLKNIRMS